MTAAAIQGAEPRSPAMVRRAYRLTMASAETVSGSVKSR